MYADQREEEVKLLEGSVEQLEYTINVLENKVRINHYFLCNSLILVAVFTFLMETYFNRLTLSKMKLKDNVCKGRSWRQSFIPYASRWKVLEMLMRK